MGVVYAAVHTETEGPAAVKLLAPGLAADAGFRERFASEIESLRKLRHPNIVQLHGFGEEQGQLFYAMELIDGTNLHEELTAGRRFNWREVARIAIDVCKALKHAHDSGVIHRDLKPANLVIDNDDNVKLTDFGIAKLFGATQVTAGRGVVGTADFMAPEQAEGKPVTPRCDLYSLGAVMYTLLSGRPPFVGKSMPEVVHKLRFDTPLPVSRFASETPSELEHIIDQLLNKDPDDRYPTALVLSKRLAAMEHALSLQGDTRPSPDLSRSDSFELTDAQTSASGIERLDPQVAKRATVALPKDETGAQEPATESQAAEFEKRTHFTPVSTKKPETQAQESKAGSVAIAVALVALLAGSLGSAAYFARRPPDSEKLYSKIQKAIDQDTLLQAEGDIKQFVKLFPDHIMHEEVNALLDETELLRLEKRMAFRARRGNKGASPIEAAYLEAARLMKTDPDRAATKLQNLVNVYCDDPAAQGTAEDCIVLAKKQLKVINAENAKRIGAYRDAIESRLRFASETEDTERAAQIRQGIIELYKGKAWAADLIQQAHQDTSSVSMIPEESSDENLRYNSSDDPEGDSADVEEDSKNDHSQSADN